ncbi:MAG: hypothetical protein ACLFSQ_11355 [Candidatus Zixiibacteriota bacterium]
MKLKNRIYGLTDILVFLMMLQGILGLVLHRLYRDSKMIAGTWHANDALTLILAFFMIIAMLRTRKGSIRAGLLWLGIIGYSIYNYGFYLLGARINVFFPIYLFAFIFSIITMILFISNLDIAEISARFSSRIKNRLLGGYFILIGFMLGIIWLIFWAFFIFAGKSLPIAEDAFRTVATMDICLISPSLIIGGKLLWNRKDWGFIISSISGVLGSFYLLLLTINSIAFIMLGLSEAPGELPIWGTLFVFTSIATIYLFSTIKKYNELKFDV